MDFSEFEHAFFFCTLSFFLGVIFSGGIRPALSPGSALLFLPSLEGYSADDFSFCHVAWQGFRVMLPLCTPLHFPLRTPPFRPPLRCSLEHLAIFLERSGFPSRWSFSARSGERDFLFPPRFTFSSPLVIVFSRTLCAFPVSLVFFQVFLRCPFFVLMGEHPSANWPRLCSVRPDGSDFL